MGDLLRLNGEFLGEMERCLCGEFRGDLSNGRGGDNRGDLLGDSFGDLERGESLLGDILGESLRGGVNRRSGAYLGDLERVRALGDNRGDQWPLGDLDLDLRRIRGDLDLKKVKKQLK